MLAGIEPYFYMQYNKDRSLYRHNYEYSIHSLTRLLKAAGFDGSAWTERYDVKRAAWRGWLLKAQRCTEFADSKDESVDIKMNQLYENCLKTAERYRPYNIY
jgi:hypothetical protein